jgi:hypothetical protein
MALCSLVIHPAWADPPEAEAEGTPATVQAELATASPVSAGQQIVVDPKTGKFRAPSAGEVAHAATLVEQMADPAFSTSHEGLYEEPSPIPGGGMMIDVQGRFQSPLMVQIEPDGTFRFTHEAGSRSGEEE